MRYMVIALVFLIVGFGAGYAFSERSAFEKYQQGRQSDAHLYSESSVAFALMNIRDAESGDTQKVIRTNCFIARSSADLIDPSFYDDPRKQKEVARLANRAKNVVSALESSGKCLGPPREG